MSVIHSRMPLATVPISRLQNGQTGYSDVLAVPAANAATLADYIDGLGTYGAPLNPSGDHGHDHSGGYFGRAMFVSVASMTLNAPQGTTGVIYPEKYYYLLLPLGAGGTTSQTDGVAVPLWVPNCDRNGAYANLAIRIRANVVATTLTASDTLQVIAKLNDASYTFSVSSPNTTGTRYLASASTSQLIPSIPGAVNNLHCNAKVVRASGGSSRGCTINIEEVELGVYQT
jgi:hypothetical protein